jgi:hypothetical protein
MSRAEAIEPGLPCLILRFLCESAHGCHRSVEQENGVPVDDALRPVFHGAFKSAPVHAPGLCNVIADPAIVAELSA